MYFALLQIEPKFLTQSKQSPEALSPKETK